MRIRNTDYKLDNLTLGRFAREILTPKKSSAPSVSNLSLLSYNIHTQNTKIIDQYVSLFSYELLCLNIFRSHKLTWRKSWRWGPSCLWPKWRARTRTGSSAGSWMGSAAEIFLLGAVLFISFLIQQMNIKVIRHVNINFLKIKLFSPLCLLKRVISRR